uniref:Ladybird homeobox 2 n=1 Tax=Vombatus ursinus TaxID=29139 RepID=A0A4X2LML4_VOMUR
GGSGRRIRADILGPAARPVPAPAPVPARDHTSPLCALEELASKTFRRLDGSVLQATEGRAALRPLSGSVTRRRRKSRTAFTTQQVLELERRFVFQKYLAPAERDGLAARLGLANAQVITWFQNRRAKLKRDVEEMKADVASLRSLPPAALRRLSLSLPESGSSPSADPDPSPDPGPELSDEEIQVDD